VPAQLNEHHRIAVSTKTAISSQAFWHAPEWLLPARLGTHDAELLSSNVLTLKATSPGRSQQPPLMVTWTTSVTRMKHSPTPIGRVGWSARPCGGAPREGLLLTMVGRISSCLRRICLSLHSSNQRKREAEDDGFNIYLRSDAKYAGWSLI